MRRHLVILLVLLGAGLEAQQLIFYDGMSSFPSGWRLDTVNGYWARSNRRYWSPGYSAHCVNAAQYNNNQNNSMRRAIDVSAYRVGLLTFWYWGYISNNTPPPPHTPDRVFLECFRGSIQAWDTIWERAGNSAAWESLGFLIPADAESLCFLFHSDYDVVDSGAYIDDIYLRGYNPDVRTAAIVTPRGTIDSGATIIPHCRVYNDSALGVSYYAKCFIEPDYEDSMLVFSHAPRCTQDVYFRAWTPRARGKWAIRCSTAYHLDAVPGNNCLVESIKVGVHDMGCAGIVQPGSVIDSGFPVTPQAYLRNYGTYGESLSAVMKLGNFYTEWVNDLFVLPGESLLVQFRTRLANGSRGLHAVTCSAAITRNPDQNPVNNALVGGVLVEVHDVAALEVTSPPTVVDSGVVVIPSALVHNPGTAREDFLSRFRIGSSYADSQLVLNLAPGDTRTVTFRAWIAQPGTYTASCSTELGMDLSRSNNCARRQFSVRYADVAVTRILKPNSQIMPGVQTPKIELLNCGTVAMSNVLCSLAIGPSYSQALTRPSLGPGVCCTLSYPTWNAGAGVWTARARVLVGGDMYPNNDTLSKTIDVSATPHHDLAVTGFLYPGRQVDPGDVVPVISVANLGNSVETNVPLRLVIDSTGGQVRVDSQVLASLAPGDEAEVAFRTWWAFSGNYRLTAFSRLTGDEARSNDTARLDVLVAAHDIATLEVLAPSGEIGIGHTIYPRIRLTNKGSVTDSFAVIAEIRRGTSLLYRDSGHVRIRRYETLNAVLPGWVPLDTGNHQIKAWANIMGDRNPDNDTIEDVFLVAEASVDAAARQIISPEDTIGTGLVWPRIRVANTGNVMISFWAAMTIRREELITYQDSSWVNALVPGEERTVGLPLWNPEVGSWLVEGRVRCAGDPNKSNDEVSGTVEVITGAFWAARASLPAGPKRRNVKDGGCLAGSEVPEPVIYALKGNGTCEFYCYDLAEGSWATLESIPLFGSTGKKKPVKKGGSLATAGQLVYATKGNNTCQFWCYEPHTAWNSGPVQTRPPTPRPLTAVPGHWSGMPDVPAGAKAIREGCGAAGVQVGETSFVYLLKGSGTTEFYRFNTRAGTWQTMASAPTGASGKPFKNGSCLATDGTSAIWALKGSTNEFFAYDVAANTWSTLAALPLTGTAGRKKAKDGASLAWLGGEGGMGSVYCLKGGNTREFFRYDFDSLSWQVQPDIPLGAGKKVKGGGALVACAYRLYALKGNNTLEFYVFNPAGRTTSQTQVMAGLPATVPACRIGVTPNPIRGSARVSLDLPEPGRICLRLLDVTGRVARVLALGNRVAGRHEFDLAGTRDLAHGVYLLRLDYKAQNLETMGFRDRSQSVSQKVVVQ